MLTIGLIRLAMNLITGVIVIIIPSDTRDIVTFIMAPVTTDLLRTDGTTGIIGIDGNQ